MREHSRLLALCGLLSALSAALLTLGGLFPLATFAAPLLAMLPLLIAAVECPLPAALGSYASAALLGLLLVPDREIALLFLFLGSYPVWRPRIERCKSRLLRVLCKLAFFFLAASGAYGVLALLLSPGFLSAEFAGWGLWALLGFAALGAVTFLLYDRVLARFTALYIRRWRDRLLKF